MYGLYEVCCLCLKVKDENGKLATDYAIHGKGKNKISNYFHESCFIKTTKREVKDEN